MKFRLLTLIILTMLHTQCSKPTPLAGGSTTTDNAKVSCSVYYTTGVAASGAKVFMRPSTYVKPVAGLPDTASIYNTVTDAMGRFFLDSVRVGKYHIEINDEKTSAVLLPCTVRTKRDSVLLDADTLRHYATISGKVDSINTKTTKAYVQVVGLARLVPVDSTGSFTIPDLPPSTYQIKVVSVDTAIKPIDVNDVKTASDSVTHVIDTVKAAPPDTAAAVIGLWGQVGGPYGGTILSFAAIGSAVFAGTNGGGVFVTTNNGASWAPVNTGIRPNANVSTFAVVGTKLIIGTDFGLYTSGNNGASWTAVTNAPQEGLVSAFAVSPVATGGAVMYSISSGSHVDFSTDGGVNWTPTSAMPSASGQALAIIPDQAGGGYIFAGTSQGVYLSKDKGSSWTSVNNGLNLTGINQSIRVLAIDGSDIIAGGGEGMFQSPDSGASWIETNTGMPQTSSIRVQALALRDSIVFSGTDADGVYYSVNKGNTWASANTGLLSTGARVQVNALSLKPNTAGGDNLFAGTNVGAFLSTNHGASWTPVNNGLLNIDVVDFAVIGTTLFAASNYGVFRSSDNGVTWTAVNSGLVSFEPQAYVRTLAVATNSSGVSTLFAGMLGLGVYYSTNNGDSWKVANTGLTDTNISILGVSSDASGGNYLFAGTPTALFVSANSGVTWSNVNGGLSFMSINAIAAVPNKTGGSAVFAGALGAGMFRSTDNGVNWTAIDSGLTTGSINDIAVGTTASGGNIVFAATDAGVFTTVNNGATWSATNNGLTDTIVTGLAVYGNSIFAGTSGGKVFVSANNGGHWTIASAGLGGISIQALCVGPKVSGGANLFAGAVGGGVWKAPLK